MRGNASDDLYKLFSFLLLLSPFFLSLKIKKIEKVPPQSLSVKSKKEEEPHVESSVWGLPLL